MLCIHTMPRALERITIVKESVALSKIHRTFYRYSDTFGYFHSMLSTGRKHPFLAKKK